MIDLVIGYPVITHINRSMTFLCGYTLRADTRHGHEAVYLTADMDELMYPTDLSAYDEFGLEKRQTRLTRSGTHQMIDFCFAAADGESPYGEELMRRHVIPYSLNDEDFSAVAHRIADILFDRLEKRGRT